jgi:hypothetical protein
MRCGRTKAALVARFVRQESVWALESAEVVPAKTAGAARDNAPRVGGGFAIGDTYVGCPECHAGTFVQCGDCKGLTCWDGGRDYVCGHCGVAGAVSEGPIADVAVHDLG